MTMIARRDPAAPDTPAAPQPPARGTVPTPQHDARALTFGAREARIVLDGKVYTLRITRQDKLILTK